MHRSTSGSASALILVAVLLAAVAAVLLFFTLGGSEDPAIAIDQGRTEKAVGAGPSDVELTDAASRRSGREGVATVETPDLVGAADLASRVGAAVRGPSALLVGRVVDGGGRPVVGAEVRVAPASDGFSFSVGDVEHLPSTTTDELGAFSFEKAPTGNNSVVVTADGFARHERRGVELSEGGRYDLGDLVVERCVFLSGRVVDEAGRGVEGAKLHRVAADDGVEGLMVFGLGGGAPLAEQLAVSGPDGAFSVDTLAAGPWRIAVVHDEHPRRTFEGTSDEPGEVRTDLLFELPRGAGIAGRVEGVDVRPGPFKVRAREAGASNPFVPFRSGELCDVASDGSFAFRGLEADADYELTVVRGATPSGDDPFTGPLGESVVSEARTFEAGTQQALLEVLPPGKLTVRVVDARTDEPVENYRVAFGDAWYPRDLRGPDGSPAMHHEDGVATFEDVAPRRETPFEQDPIVRVTADGYARQDVKVTTPGPGQTVDVGVVRLERAPLAIVTVRDGAGAPVANARVTLTRASRERSGTTFDVEVANGDVSFGGDDAQRGRTDENGVVRLTLPTVNGEAELRVQHGDFADYVAMVTAPTNDRDLEHTVVLGPGGRVLVRVTDAAGAPVPWARVEHQAPGDRSFPGTATPKTDSSGEARFSRLAPGTHRFRPSTEQRGNGLFLMSFDDGSGAGDGGGTWTDVVVEHGSDETVVLVHDAGTSVVGTVRQDGLPLVGARVSLKKKRSGADGDERSRAVAVVMDSDAGGFVDFGGGPSAKTNGEGHYRLEGVQPGDYELRVTHPDRASPDSRDVTIVGGVENRVDVDLALNGISGTVRDEEGRPVAGLSVRVERATGDTGDTVMRAFFVTDSGGGGAASIGGGGPKGTVTDAQGNYELQGVPADTPVRVVVSESDHEPFTREVKSDELELTPTEFRRGVDLVAKRGGAVQVVVQESQRAQFVFASVRAVRLDDAGVEVPGSDAFGFVQEDGARLNGLEPGTWRVSVQPMDGSVEPRTQDVEIPPGESVTVEF
ncbi:MAG: carboxypeptidase regulatory-like domain-containing protein [Planctomycetota bacterium]